MLALVLLGCGGAPEVGPAVEVVDCAEVACPWTRPSLGLSIPTTGCPISAGWGLGFPPETQEDLLELLRERRDAWCRLEDIDYLLEARMPEPDPSRADATGTWTAVLSHSRPCAPATSLPPQTFEVREQHLTEASRQELRAWLEENIVPQRAALRLSVQLTGVAHEVVVEGRQSLLKQAAWRLGAQRKDGDDWATELWVPVADTTVDASAFEACVPELLEGSWHVPYRFRYSPEGREVTGRLEGGTLLLEVQPLPEPTPEPP